MTQKGATAVTQKGARSCDRVQQAYTKAYDKL